MTQEHQETLNEIFLGKEDPDLAFKPMTNNLKEITDNFYDFLVPSPEELCFSDPSYAEELSTEFEKLKAQLSALINQKEKEHKLEAYLEIDLLVAEQEQRYETLEYAELHNDLEDRIKQLKEELNKEGE